MVEPGGQREFQWGATTHIGELAKAVCEDVGPEFDENIAAGRAAEPTVVSIEFDSDEGFRQFEVIVFFVPKIALRPLLDKNGSSW